MAGTADRRTRNRLARRRAGVAAPADIAEATDDAPASLHTHIPSRSALIASAEPDTLTSLVEVGEAALLRWDEQLAARKDVDDATGSLAILWAVSDMFLAAPSPATTMTMDLLALPDRMLTRASDFGALTAVPPTTSSTDKSVDGATLRTLAWFTALHGALLIDDLSVGVGATGRELGSFITRSFLAGWGASEQRLDDARSVARMLDAPQRVINQEPA